MLKNAFSFGDAALIGLPTLAGAGYGAYRASEEDRLRDALIGGIAGALMGTGAVFGKRHLRDIRLEAEKAMNAHKAKILEESGQAGKVIPVTTGGMTTTIPSTVEGIDAQLAKLDSLLT